MSFGPRALLAASAFAVGVLAAPWTSASDSPDHGLAYTDLTVLSVNPLGLQNTYELDLWWRLFDPGDSTLLANNAFSVGLAPRVTPALVRLGATVKLRPLNIFKLEVRGEYLAYFGNFDAVQSFASPRADFSDTALARGGDAGRNRATDGWQLTLDAELRARLGPVVLRSRLRAGYVDVDLGNGDPVYYEPFYDLLLPRAGWLLTHDADVLVVLGPHLTLGVRHAFAAVAYPADAYLAGEPHRTTASPVHRLGPLVAWRFFDEPGAAFNEPTLVLFVLWNVVHPWRAGVEVDQALPTVALAFAFTGELL